MTVTRSASTRSTARSGSQRAICTDAMPTAAGRSTPLSSPRRGTSVPAPGPRRRPPARGPAASDPAFQASPRWVCSTAFGPPGRAGGEDGEGQVGRGSPRTPRARRAAAGGSASNGSPAPGGHGDRARGVGDRRPGPPERQLRRDLGQATPPASASPAAGWTGTATAPSRQQARKRSAAARPLGSCQATASPRRTPARRRRPARPSTAEASSRRPAGASPSTTRWRAAAARTESSGVERAHPPGTAGPAVSRAVVCGSVAGSRALRLTGAAGRRAQCGSQASGSAVSRTEVLGELARGHLGQRHVLEHLAQAGPHRHPHLLEVLGGAVVAGGLGPEAPHLGQRPVERPDHLGQGDLLGRPGQAVAAVGPALAGHQPGPAEVGQDGAEEPRREALVGGELVGGLGPPAAASDSRARRP